MRYSSGADLLVMKRACAGPAALALKAARANGSTVRGGPRSLARGGSLGYMGSLGDAAALAATKTAAIGVGSKYAGAAAGTSIAAYVGAGAWAGPIGAAAGLIIGLALSSVFKKNYLNVAQANAAEDAAVNVFNQYKQIAGQIAGRQLGLDTMHTIWLGAIYSGLFPLNNARESFHEGNLKYPGRPEWVTYALDQGAGPTDHFATVWQKMQSTPSPTAATATAAPGSYVMARPRVGVMPVGSAGGRVMLRGFGSLGDYTSGVPDAVTFVDQFMIPMMTSNRPPWEIPTSPLAHQLLYDVADAWIAEHGDSGSTPFVAKAATIAPNTAGTLTPADPTQGATLPVGPGPGGSGVVGASNTYQLTPVTNPTTGATTYQVSPVGYTPGTTAPLTGSAPAGALTAGLSSIPAWGYLVVAAGLFFAMARPGESPERIAAQARRSRRRTR